MRENKKFDETRKVFREKNRVFASRGVLTPDAVKKANEELEQLKSKCSEFETPNLNAVIRFDNGFIEEREFFTFLKDMVWSDQFKCYLWNAPGGLLRSKTPIIWGFYHARSKGGEGKSNYFAGEKNTKSYPTIGKGHYGSNGKGNGSKKR